MTQTWIVSGPVTELQALRAEIEDLRVTGMTIEGPSERHSDFMDSDDFGYSPWAQLIINITSTVGAAGIIEFARVLRRKIAERKELEMKEVKEEAKEAKESSGDE
jgi:hypothetical protein